MHLVGTMVVLSPETKLKHKVYNIISLLCNVVQCPFCMLLLADSLQWTWVGLYLLPIFTHEHCNLDLKPVLNADCLATVSVLFHLLMAELLRRFLVL